MDRGPAYPPPGPVAPGHVGITAIGHSTFLLRFATADGGMLSVLTDPQFSERASPVPWAGPKRARAPGIALDALPRIDAVLLSHDHYDHMDLPSLRALHARWAPRVITTPGNARRLARAGMPGAVELDVVAELHCRPGAGNGHAGTALLRPHPLRPVQDRVGRVHG